MANGITALKKIQLGKESGGAPGTPVAATTIWRGTGVLKHMPNVVHVREQIGVAMPTTRAYIPKDEARIILDPVEATFQQLPYLFESGVSIETPTPDGSGSDYIYAYSMPTTTANTIETYTVQGGNNQLVRQADYCFCEKFKLTGNAAEGIMMSAELRGRTAVDGSFTGALSAPALLPAHHLIFGNTTLAIDAVGGTLGATAVGNTLKSFELDVTTGYTADWTNGSIEFDDVYWSIDAFSATLKLVYKHNASADAQRDLFEVATPRQLRLQVTGPAFVTPGTTYSVYTAQINCAGIYTVFDDGEDNGLSIVEAEMKIGYDATAGLGLGFLMAIESSALP
jgi:hypothetical protein